MVYTRLRSWKAYAISTLASLRRNSYMQRHVMSLVADRGLGIRPEQRNDMAATPTPLVEYSQMV